MKIEDIGPELQQQAVGKSADELVELAKKHGVELTQEQLEQVSGGGWLPGSALENGCPDCGSKNVHVSSIGQTMRYECKNCGKVWM